MKPTKSTNDQIYQAVIDLVNTNRIATRETVARIVGLPLGIVDDHLKRLVSDERLYRPARGVYEPTQEQPPDRPVSMTYLANGRLKLEVGDDLVELSIREGRNAAASMAGLLFQFKFQS